MKIFLTAASVLALTAITTPALALSPQMAAKKELEGWSRAANQYVETCNVGNLREQMPRDKAVHAYDCFAEIIDREITFQFPDLYKTLDEKMKEAHHAYANGQSWEKTLDQLTEASNEYNAAVAQRNKNARANN